MDGNTLSITHPLMLSPLRRSPRSGVSDVMLLCISSASIRVPFVSLNSSLRFAGVLCPWIFFFITSLHHISLLPLSSHPASLLFLVRLLSVVRLLLQIRQYSRRVAKAAGALISLINPPLRLFPLHVGCLRAPNVVVFLRIGSACCLIPFFLFFFIWETNVHLAYWFTS